MMRSEGISKRLAGIAVLACLAGTLGPSPATAAEESAANTGVVFKQPGRVVEGRTLFKAPDGGARKLDFRRAPGAATTETRDRRRRRRDPARWKRRPAGG